MLQALDKLLRQNVSTAYPSGVSFSKFSLGVSRGTLCQELTLELVYRRGKVVTGHHRLEGTDFRGRPPRRRGQQSAHEAVWRSGLQRFLPSRLA